MISIEILEAIGKLESFEDQVHQAALYYIQQGIRVLPLERRGRGLNRNGISYASASRKKEIIDKWFGPNGKYRGCNIGIACGLNQGGVFAVDVDDKKGKNGSVMLEALEKQHEAKLLGPRQKSPSGGYHYLFKWVPNARSSTDKIANGIDTRGGDIDMCKSHIVAFPSVAESKTDIGTYLPYEWDIGGELTDPPAWVINALGEAWSSAKGTGRGNENLDSSDFESSYSIRQIGNMIKDIDMETITYDEWLWIGQAIHSQHPNEKGLELWDRWSQRGERYKANECDIRWHSFKEEGSMRIGTLIHIAQKHGGYDPRTQGRDVIEAEEFGDEVEALNATFAVTVIGGSVRIIMENEPNPLDPLAERFRFLDRTGFLTMMENQKAAIADNKGGVKLVNKGQLWLSDERRRTYPNGIAFMPDYDKEINGAFNTWQPWPINDQVPYSWDKFDNHLKYVVCNGNTDHYEWLLDWMADIIQDPTKPKGSCLVLSGDEGTGKGTLAHTLGKLVGLHYKHVTDEDHLIGRFNGHLQDAILVFADEVTYGGSKKTAGKLKSLVTEPVLTAERKGIDATRYMNYTRLIIASNESWFIPAGPQSRRWFVLNVNNSKANDTEYFRAIRNQMEHESGYEGLMHFLRNRVIKSNLRFAPVTDKLKQQRSMLAVQDSAIEWWAYCCEIGYVDGVMVAGKEWNAQNETQWPEGDVSVAEFHAAYEDWATDKRLKRHSLTVFSETMKGLGVNKVRRRDNRPNAEIKRPTYFNIPNYKDAVHMLETRGGVTLNISTNEEETA